MVDVKKIRENVSKVTNKISSSKLPSHKHCRICHQPIPVAAEPRVCKDDACIDKNAQDEKNQRTVRIAMFVFFGLFAIPYILALGARMMG